MATRGIEYLPLREIMSAERNPRAHESLPDVRDSMGRFGVVESIVRDDRTGQLVAGHGRVEALTELERDGGDPPDGVGLSEDGEWLVPVTVGWSSASDDEAVAAGVALNRTGDTSGWDNPDLLAVLDDVSKTYAGLKGIGFDEEAVASLRRLVEASGGAVDAAAEWAKAGMPEFASENMQGAFKTTVHFATEEDADRFFKMVGRDRASYFWWPESDGHRGMDISRQFVLAGENDAGVDS